MATSVLPELKAKGFRTRFVCFQGYTDLLEDNPLLDEVVPVANGNWETVNKATASLEKAYKRVGLYYPYEHQGIDPPHPMAIHLTSVFCRQAGVSPHDNLYVTLTDEHRAWAQGLDKTILIHTTTGWSPYKDWPMSHWRQLVSQLKTETGYDILQVGGASDRRVPEIDFLESPSRRHSIAAVAACRLFIGLDSFLNHASRAVQKPALILWGSSHPVGTGYAQNYNLVNGVLWQPEFGYDTTTLRCQPCYRNYRQGKPGEQGPCTNLVPSRESIMHSDRVERTGIHACMAGNSVEAVLLHTLKILELAS